MATPTLRAVAVTGPTPSFAEPVEIYDLTGGGGAPEFSELAGSVPGVTGADLQAILNALATRVKALEDATP